MAEHKLIGLGPLDGIGQSISFWLPARKLRCSRLKVVRYC